MPSFSPYTLGLNPYREIVFRSTSQIAGVRTVNRLFAPFSDVRKKKGLRISADPSSRMRKIGFIVVLLRGCLSTLGLFVGLFVVMGLPFFSAFHTRCSPFGSLYSQSHLAFEQKKKARTTEAGIYQQSSTLRWCSVILAFAMGKSL